ncbi:hypothetical protein [Corynebacterium belfantii]
MYGVRKMWHVLTREGIEMKCPEFSS